MAKKFCLILIGLLLTIFPAASHDGRGVVIQPNPYTGGELNTLNPLLCDNTGCQEIAGFLFPNLLATDTTPGLLVGADLQEDNSQTLTLDKDLRWSDSRPITAYDVFYGLLAIVQGVTNLPFEQADWIRNHITGARVIDEHSIDFQYVAPDCASLPRSNFPVVPAHVFDPDFSSFVDKMNAEAEGIQPFKTWLEAYNNFFFSTDFGLKPTATAGIFQFQAVRPSEDIRLSADKSAFVYADVPNGMTPLDMFLAGQADVLINPPAERWDDLRATPGLQIAQFPSGMMDYIVFNTADPNKPKDAFNDKGQPNEQGHHPLFGDPRVRRAVQMAIDTPELIEVAFHGNATPVASNLSPVSWGFNPDLKPLDYDPIGAERLLEEAGWKATNFGGGRVCHGCMYGQEGSGLSFSLVVSSGDSERDEVADLIVEQLRRVGFSVNLDYDDFSLVDGQFFDAYLTGSTVGADPDQTAQLTRAGDVVGTEWNVGSYSNDDVEKLMQQAAHVPDCDPEVRAGIYRQIQAVLHDDQPYAWLYARDEMYVARGGVSGFAPHPGQPFWNVRDWVVTP